MPKEEICKRSRISGRVQGVSFRYYTCRTAIALGLTGWVANNHLRDSQSTGGTHGNKQIELFARSHRAGWESWGTEF